MANQNACSIMVETAGFEPACTLDGTPTIQR